MHIISGELRKAPFVKPNVGQNGESQLFIVELSEVIKDRQSGENTYTNYSAAIFAKGGQIDFYNRVLVEGNFIVVTGDKLRIKVSDCGKYTKLDLENARLENSKYIESNGQAQQPGGFAQQAPQQAPQSHQQQAPHNQGGFQPQQSHQQQGYQQSPQPQQNQMQQQAQYQPQQPQQNNQPQQGQPQVEGGFDDDIPF